MSESYTIVPLEQQVREWLVGEGHSCVPHEDGRRATLGELKAALASISGLTVEWSSHDASLESAEGFHSQLLISDPIGGDGDPCGFHFRGGSDELIELVTTALARFVGPLVIISHSGAFTKVVYAS